MTVVTYRGVKYDADARKHRTLKHVVAEETYRGIKHTEQVEVAK